MEQVKSTSFVVIDHHLNHWVEMTAMPTDHEKPRRSLQADFVDGDDVRAPLSPWGLASSTTCD
jgi:hypothetical protein